MKQWEYKTITFVGEEQLNRLGAEGWELVIIINAKYSGRNCIFKREKL